LVLIDVVTELAGTFKIKLCSLLVHEKYSPSICKSRLNVPTSFAAESTFSESFLHLLVFSTTLLHPTIREYHIYENSCNY